MLSSVPEEEEEEEEKIVVSIPGVRLNKVIPKRKKVYALKLRGLLDEYSKCLLVSVNNVSSRQIADMRKDFRGRARFLFGKNTLIRKVLREYMKQTRNKNLMCLMENVRGNIGFVFTKESIPLLRKEIEQRQRQASAKAGVDAPVNVYVPAGPTGMEPTQTQMFQAMNIPTRINRGQIDITHRVQLIKRGEKVGASASALLNSLNIRPFYYGMTVEKVYDSGQIYDASALDITTEMVANAFYSGLQSVAAFSLEINHPTIVSAPHSILHAYKKVLALGLEMSNSYSWEGLETMKNMIENPELFANNSAIVVADGASGEVPENTGGTAVEEPVVEEEDEATVSSEAPAGIFNMGNDSSSDSDSDSSSDSA